MQERAVYSRCTSICIYGITLSISMQAINLFLQYGFPLYAFGSLVQSASNATPIPTNHLIPQRQLRTAGDKESSGPMPTPYTSTFSLTSLRAASRWLSPTLAIDMVSFHSMICKWLSYFVSWLRFKPCRYGSNFANIGSAARVTHGKFLLRFDQTNMGLSTETTEETSYDGIVRMSTPYGQSITRIVTSNTTKDLEIVRALQDQLKVRSVPRSSHCGSTTPALDLTMFNEPYYRAGDDTTLPEAVMRLTAALSRRS